MLRDPRYEIIKLLIEKEQVKSISDIFQFIPKTTVYKDLGINFNRFDRAIIDPSIFRMQELLQLAEMFEIDPREFVTMALEQAISVKNKNQHRRKQLLPE